MTYTASVIGLTKPGTYETLALFECPTARSAFYAARAYARKASKRNRLNHAFTQFMLWRDGVFLCSDYVSDR